MLGFYKAFSIKIKTYMSIKKDFNSYISKRIKGKIDELSLIDALIYSFDKNGAYTYKYHGIKGLVQFDINVPSPLISYPNVKCEIADIFIIFIGQDEIRYTFLQNKYSRVGGSDHLIPKVNTRQHYLLSERVLFNPLKTGLPSNILKSGLCHGAGSYGDFFNNDHDYDMRYFVSKTLFPKNNRTLDFYGRKKVRSFFNTYLDSYWFNYINGIFECPHVSNLDDFEIMAKRMLIGSPVDIKNKDLSKYFAKLIRFIIKSSNKADDGILERLHTIIPGEDKDNDNFVEPTFSNNYVVVDYSKRVINPLYNE